MKITLKNGHDVFLTDHDFVVNGVEGKVFAKGGSLYKIYHDRSKVISVAKIDELSVLSLHNILRPENIILNASGDPIGYTTRHIPHNYILPRLFAQHFRQRMKLTPSILFRLVRKMQKTIEFIHSKGISLGNISEMDFLSASDFADVYFIGVDGYQNQKAELQDWYAFAVISFNLLTGIHPYKGKHKDTLAERIVRNISVFNTDVDVPRRTMNAIPGEYYEWYFKVLEKGERLPPPDKVSEVGVVAKAPYKSSTDKLIITQCFDTDENVIGYYHALKRDIVITNENITVLGNGVFDCIASHPWRHGGVVGFSTKNDIPLICYISHGKAQLWSITQDGLIGIPFQCVASAVTSIEGRIYLLSGCTILELVAIESGGSFIVSLKPVVTVFEQTAQLFDGVAVQNLMGACWIHIFNKSLSSKQCRIQELENGSKIIDAKYERNVFQVVTYLNGYERYVFRFTQDHQTELLNHFHNIDYCGINFTVLDNGICASMNEDGTVDLFRNTYKSKAKVVLVDSAIDRMMRFYNNGTNVWFSHDNKMFQLEMRKMG